MSDKRECPACNGNGGHTRITTSQLGVKQTEWIKCPTCNGSGTVSK